MFVDDAACDQVFLDDSFKYWRIAVAIPGTFWVHHRDRSPFADAQAVRFRAKDAPLLRELQLLQSPLQELPGGKAALFVAALRIRLIAAQKDVTPRDRYADCVGDDSLRIGQKSVTSTSSPFS